MEVHWHDKFSDNKKKSLNHLAKDREKLFLKKEVTQNSQHRGKEIEVCLTRKLFYQAWQNIFLFHTHIASRAVTPSLHILLEYIWIHTLDQTH